DQARVESSKEILRDAGLGGLYAWARDRLPHGHAAVFAYRWDHVEPGPQSARWGAFHSSELPYIFGTLDTAPERSFTEQDRQVSARISSYWINFIKAGDPNGASLPRWPQLRLDQPMMLELGDGASPRPLLPPEKLEV